MMRGKSWTPESLRKVGGAAGVGRTFLEENFDRSTANPAHRVHRRAAMAVLKALLPEPGADIKGAMQPRDELQTAAGYQQHADKFAELMRILVNDLRIVSPSAREEDAEHPDATAAERPHFQLTHDYLVPSLREWLAAGQKENWRGRALLRLEERSDQWNRDPQTRYLPNIVEFVSISLGMFKAFVADVMANEEYPQAEVPKDWRRANAEASPTDDCPVQWVSWYDAVMFCNWLSRQHGCTPCYTLVKDEESGQTEWRCDWKADGYRLPTESEWEYACRAQAETEYCFGDDASPLDDYAISYGNSNNRTWPGGQRLPNGFGLFDVHGNVWEWCWDWHDDYPETVEPDPTGTDAGDVRVLRGGSRNIYPEDLRAALRSWYLPEIHDYVEGFRLVVCFWRQDLSIR